MTINNLLEQLSFHDGEIEDIFIRKQDIIIHFWLTAFLQSAKVKELFALSGKASKDCLSVQIRFANCLNLQHDFPVENDRLLLDDYELYDVTHNAATNEIAFHLQNSLTHAFSTISFRCDNIDILSF